MKVMNIYNSGNTLKGFLKNINIKIAGSGIHEMKVDLSEYWYGAGNSNNWEDESKDRVG